MKAVIITVAGISSRFNEEIPEEQRKLKAIYYEDEAKKTLLYQMVEKNKGKDFIVVVGGYKFDDLEEYIKLNISPETAKKIILINNPHYEDLSSGYSLYLGIEALKNTEVTEVVFIEGDLHVDGETFDKVKASAKNVITTTSEPILSKKSVVLYKDAGDKYKYAFNSSHGLLEIKEPFKEIYNSGQTWKFTDMQRLFTASDGYFCNAKEGTNLEIINRYFMDVDSQDVEILRFKEWVNCNTREDYEGIKRNWGN